MKKTKRIYTSTKMGGDNGGWRSISTNSTIRAQILLVLVGVITWCITYLANTLPDAPLVELAQSYTVSGDERLIKMEIRNLSREKKISNLKLGLSSRVKSHGKYSKHSLFALAPAAEGDRSKSYTLTNDETVMFEIGDIYPGQEFILLTSYSGTDSPEVRLVSSDQPVYLLNSGFITRLVKWIVPGLLMIAAVVIFYFMYSLLCLSVRSTYHRKKL